MDFEAKRLDLLSMARKACKVARSHQPVEVLRGVLIESSSQSNEVTFIATDFEAAIVQKEIATVQTEGSIVIDAALLAGILERLPGETVKFSSPSKISVKIWAESSVFNINCLSGNHYPKPVMPFPDETVKLSGICSLAKKTVFVTSHDTSKPILTGVKSNIQQDSAVVSASDGTHMMIVKSNAEYSDALEILLPASAFQALASISHDEDVFEVGVIGKEVVFTKRQQLFSMKTLTGTFLDVTKVVKSINPAYTAVVQMEEMKDALERIAITDDIVNLAFRENAVYFSAVTEISASREEIRANAVTPTPKGGFYYKINHFLKLSQIFTGPFKLILDATGNMLIRNSTEIFFQLPNQKPRPKQKPKEQDQNKEEAA